jgi:RNA polymerase sigma-70 factor (ECF subfamily)
VLLRRSPRVLPEPGVHDLAGLYDRHAVLVERWVRRLGGPACDVEDCVQEVFLIACRKLQGFTGDAKVTTWLFRVVRNVVRKQRRRARMRAWLAALMRRTEDGAGGGAAAGLAADAGESQGDVVRLYLALDRLPEAARTAVVLFDIEGLPGEEVARLLGCSTGALWVRLHRARARLADLLAMAEAGEKGP